MRSRKLRICALTSSSSDPTTALCSGSRVTTSSSCSQQSEDVAASPTMANARKASDMARTSELEMGWDERPYDLVDWEAEAKLGWWTRLWRAKWNLKPRGPTWLPEIIR